MNEKSKKIIQEEILNLPKEVQNVINTLGWEKISEEIGKKYKLSEDEIITLQLETASLVLGFIDEDSFAVNIEDEVGTSKGEAEKIAGEITEKILIPISDKITESIKEKTKNKKTSWEQNVNFTLSGGDYSVLLDKINDRNTNIVRTNPSRNSNRIMDIKNRL